MTILHSSSSDEPGKQVEKATRPLTESVADNISKVDAQEPSSQGLAQIPCWEEASTLAPGSNSPSTADECPDERRVKFSETWKHHQDLDGQTLGNYHRLHQVGSWCYGTLFTAEYAQLHRKVRLITLDAPWSANAKLKRWFLSRSRAIARIQNASVASSVIECDEHEEVVFIALPARGKTKIHELRESTQRAILKPTIEPLSQAFYLLLEGLATLHNQGIVHGSIDVDHIAAGDGTDEIQIDLFATGIPESQYIREDGGEMTDRRLAQRHDYQQLARAFLAILIGVKCNELPTAVQRGWVQKQLPFMPHKLVKLLTNLANEGLLLERVESELGKLNQIRYEPLSKVSWRESLSTVLAAFSWGWVAVLGVGLLLVPVSVLFTPELARRIAIPIYAAILILFVITNAFLEAVFGKSIPRSMMGYKLVNRSGRQPGLKERMVRSVSLFGILVALSALLTTILIAVDPFKISESKWSFYSIVSLIVASLLLYASALLFGGQPFHEWLSQTMWVFHKRIEDTPMPFLSEARENNSTDFPPSLALYSEHEQQDRIDEILIENELGIGGMGMVYRAFDESLQRPVALKVVMAFSADTEEIVQRFRREAQLGSILNHPNIAKVYKVGMWHDRPFMAMEFVDGNTLQQIVSKIGPIPIHQAWRWIRQAAIGLQEADSHGIIHRDIKPANLMVTRDGTIKLMDFGISKFTQDDQEEIQDTAGSESTNYPTLVQTGSENIELTRVGALLGTPGYMSPEQARSEETDRRSDIYSLGLTLSYLLAGKSPFDGIESCELLMRQASGQIPPVRFGQLSKDQNQVLAKMLAPSRTDRFQTYAELIDALEKSKPVEARLPATTRRFMAIALDFVVWLSAFIGVYFVCTLYERLSGVMGLPVAIKATIAIISFLAVIGYFIACTVWLGGTPSQSMLGLQVQRFDGGKVGWLQASLRFLAKYPMLFLAFLLTLYFLNRGPQTTQILLLLEWASLAGVIASYLLVSWNYSKHRKAIHDYVAGTRIVYAKKGLLEVDLEQLFS